MRDVGRLEAWRRLRAAADLLDHRVRALRAGGDGPELEAYAEARDVDRRARRGIARRLRALDAKIEGER